MTVLADPTPDMLCMLRLDNGRAAERSAAELAHAGIHHGVNHLLAQFSGQLQHADGLAVE